MKPQETPSLRDVFDVVVAGVDAVATTGAIVPGLLLCVPGFVLVLGPVAVLAVALGLVAAVIALALGLLALPIVGAVYALRGWRSHHRPRRMAGTTVYPRPA